MKYKWRKELIYKRKQDAIYFYQTIREIAKKHDGDLQVQSTDLVNQPNSICIPVLMLTVQSKTQEQATEISIEIMERMRDAKIELVQEMATIYVYQNPK